jgi:predicted MFS family arabinose efflux permease
LGSALGGVAVTKLGYRGAFVIDALSFLVSAWCVWRVPESAMRARAPRAETVERTGFWEDWREGWRYVFGHRLALLLIGINVIWSVGGGACNLMYERLGGVVLGPQDGWSSDAALSLMYVSLGVSLFVGMLLARRVGAWVEMRGLTVPFIGWTLVLHGLFFALGGVAGHLWGFAAAVFASRFVIGVEFGLQDTLLIRALPDHLRGRVMTSDRATEMLVTGGSLLAAGGLLRWFSPAALTVAAGLVTALPGVVWLLVCSLAGVKNEVAQATRRLS